MTKNDQAICFHNFLLKAEEKVLKPDLLKDPSGNNFRAISEAAILEAINPLLYENSIDYSIAVKKSDLQIKEFNGKILFLATCEVRIEFFVNGENEPIAYSEALGMGLDSGDKAMGKAYTYAVKYALMKKIRLLYADDSDFSKSETINTKEPVREEKKTSEGNSVKKEKKTSGEPLLTDNMSNYIVGLTKRLGIDSGEFVVRFGYTPDCKQIPMKRAREIIADLQKLEDDLPF